MKIKKIPIVLTVIFFATMIFLSLSARAIHNRMIPNVTVSRLTKEDFEYVNLLDDGVTSMTNTEQLTAISKELYDSGEIYVIASVEKNGDMRTIAQAFRIEIGLDNGEYYEVKNEFLDRKLRFIVDSSEDLHDGVEVYIVN